MKVIALYLPQFHEIPENNEWWGEGFTEWVNVKKAKPLFKNHNQPFVPLEQNYYDLLDLKTLKWQFDIARQYGVYGFSIYHYWFNGKLLLEKPLELILANPSLDLHFNICWANENWTNSWVSSNEKILMQQEYGNEKNWGEHFNYLLKYFKDKRYIFIDNKPLLTIYRPEIIPSLENMMKYWNDLAKKNGFDGISFAYQHVNYKLQKRKEDSVFDYNIEYQPMYSLVNDDNILLKTLKLIKKKLNSISKKNDNVLSGISLKVRIKQYDRLWNKIITSRPDSKKAIPGAFVRWDNTPRKGSKGLVIKGETPQKFEKYMIQQIINARNNYKKDYIFIFAWNEWAEGGFLEPDEKNKFKYLEALKNALVVTNEFPYHER